MRQGQLRKKIQNYTYGLNDRLHLDASTNIFKGINEKTEERVTIKVIDMKEPKSKEYKRKTDEELEFYKKVRNLNIVAVYDIYSTTNNCYIISEYMDQGDLKNLLTKRGKLAEEQCVAIFKDIFHGYKEIVTYGFIHCNLKPENIYFKNKIAKIGNFGSCTKIHSNSNYSQKQENKFNYYSSPEVIEENKYSIKSDIWSLGMILYEILHGRLPWMFNKQQKLSKQQILEKMKEQYMIDQKISEEIKDFLQKCLNPNIKERKDLKELKSHPFIEKILSVPTINQQLHHKQRILSNNESPEQRKHKQEEEFLLIQHLDKIISQNKRQSTPYNSIRTEKQLTCMINWMRFLFRLYQRVSSADEIFSYYFLEEHQRSKGKTDNFQQLKFIILKQLYVQLNCLKENLFSGINAFNFHQWSLFYEEKDKLKKYADIVRNYELRYEKIWPYFESLIQQLNKKNHKAQQLQKTALICKRILNTNFKLTQCNSIIALAISLREIKRIWSKIMWNKDVILFKEGKSKQKQEYNLNKSKNLLVLIDFLMTYYQLNSLLVDDFYKIDYFEKMSKLQIIIEYQSVELEWDSIKEIEKKMELLNLFQSI